MGHNAESLTPHKENQMFKMINPNKTTAFIYGAIVGGFSVYVLRIARENY